MRLCHCQRGNSCCVSVPTVFWTYLRASVTHQRDAAAESYLLWEQKPETITWGRMCPVICNKHQFWLLCGTILPYFFPLLWILKIRIINALFKEKTMICGWFNVCSVFCKKMDFGAFCIAGACTYQCYKIWMCSISLAIFKLTAFWILYIYK